MQTFIEFLHASGWQKPLLPDLTKAMTRIIRKGQQGFPDWDWRTAQIAPPHHKLMLVLARAGTRGLSRAELSGLIDLEGETLDDLLAALVRSGEVGVSTTTDGRRVYRRLI